MRKALSMFLAVIMIAAVFSSCAVRDELRISSSIEVTSSGAAGYAEWLTDRLGTVTDSVVLGLGDSSSYGVDMSDFEDDGYVIRNQGDDVVIFGKTDEGLDLAVRKYANAVSQGNEVENTVYHEGYRIEKFTLFGKDISEYTIVYPTDHNENMSFAASELKKLIKQACGADLPILVGEDASPAIRLEHSDKAEFKIGGYEYYEKDGDLVISGAVREGVCNGVYRFLEKECGWDWLIYGNSDLQETDHLVIESGLYETETPAFEWHIVSRNVSNLPFKSDKTVAENAYLKMSTSQQSYPVNHANHGLTKHNWAGWEPNNHTGQICYTNEGYYDTAVYNILQYLKKQEEAGQIIGETIRAIDISQGDSGTYCKCDECSEIVMEEGSIMGPVIRWANAVAEEVNAAYPGTDLLFKVFAYYNAFKPPMKTVPNEWVSVSYAPNGSCANHVMDGSQCDPDTDTDFGVSGVEFGQYLDDWCAVSDNIYVWYYHIGDSFNYYNVWDLIYYDYKNMYELGVKGVYFYNYARGMGLKTVEHMLAWYLLWDIDMTWEEYEALFDRALEAEYGDGWQSMKELLRMYGELENDKCWNCWGYSDRVTGIDMYDLGYMEQNYGTMKALAEEVVTLAANSYQETLAEMFSASVYYCGCYTSFFKDYNAGDTEALAELASDYQKIIDRFTENGYNFNRIPNISKFSIGATIWEEVTEEWIYSRDRLPAGDAPEREFTGAVALNYIIEDMAEVTDAASAAEVFKAVQMYSALGAGEQEKVTGIDGVISSLEDATGYYDEESMKLKVMSFNVRYNELTEDRIQRVIQTIRNESPDVIGIQEGMPEMCNAMVEALGEEYEMLGHGRDPDTGGENCNVFYKKSEFNLIDSGTKWVSYNPDSWSIYHGSYCARIMTYQILERISDGQQFLHVNTHLDNSNTEVRTAQAKILVNYLTYKFENKYPTFITGDFNCSEGTNEFNTIIDAGFEATNAYGENKRTYQGYGEASSIIDFIFVDGLLPVKTYKVCDEQIDGEWVSDHNAIVSEIILYPTYKSATTVS